MIGRGGPTASLDTVTLRYDKAVALDAVSLALAAARVAIDPLRRLRAVDPLSRSRHRRCVATVPGPCADRRFVRQPCSSAIPRYHRNFELRRINVSSG